MKDEEFIVDEHCLYHEQPCTLRSKPDSKGECVVETMSGKFIHIHKSEIEVGIRANAKWFKADDDSK